MRDDSGSVAVLGDRHAAAGDDEGYRGGDVQGAGGVAPGAADVDRIGGGDDRGHAAAHGSDRAAEFGDGFAAHPHRHEQAADLRGRGLAGHDDVEGDFGIGVGQGFPGGEAGQDGFQIVGHPGCGGSGGAGGGVGAAGDRQEVCQQFMALLAGDAFWVELHAEDRQRSVADGH